MSGWFSMSRKMFNHPIFEGNAERVGVWAWMLATAAWKPTEFEIGGKTITLQRGQLCISQRQIEDETGMSRQSFRTFLATLELTQTVTKDVTHGRTILTICNYDKYQQSPKDSNPPKNHAATNDQPTNKQINKITTSSIEEDAATPPIEVSVLTKAVWSEGLRYLVSCGVAQNHARSFLGKCRKSHTDAAILSAIEATQKSGTQDPVPYLSQILDGKKNPTITEIMNDLAKEDLG